MTEPTHIVIDASPPAPAVPAYQPQIPELHRRIGELLSWNDQLTTEMRRRAEEANVLDDQVRRLSACVQQVRDVLVASGLFTADQVSADNLPARVGDALAAMKPKHRDAWLMTKG